MKIAYINDQVLWGFQISRQVSIELNGFGDKIMKTSVYFWLQCGIAAGVMTAAITSPIGSFAQEGGATGGNAPADATVAVPVVASQSALALFVADPAEFLAQGGDLAGLIASVALADPSVVAQIEAAATAEGAPAGAAEAVADGLVAAASAGIAQGATNDQVASMVAAAVRTDVGVADAVAALVSGSDSDSLVSAISEELVAITKAAVAGDSNPDVVTALVRATVVSNPDTTADMIAVAATSENLSEAVGEGLGQASKQLIAQGQVGPGGDVARIVAESVDGALSAGFNTGSSETNVADTGNDAPADIGEVGDAGPVEAPAVAPAEIGGAGATAGSTDATTGGDTTGAATGGATGSLGSSSGTTGSGGGSSTSNSASPTG
jgi:hypothetical protein